MNQIHGRMDATGKRFAIVVSRWNELVTKELLSGALAELNRFGAAEIEVIHVPGTWEIPVVAAGLCNRPADTKPNAVIALGCIMQGHTTHAQLLGADVGNALMTLQRKFSMPISWGILTPETQEQALERSGLKLGNKGREAAGAAIEMASVLEQL